ncbi:hypothetical protein WR25_19992 [Diploscapter pachys]|uniref:Innexin n=1 Tax=Diploscapter pachys TaxID=2018661 RepID=A0A2A2LDZ5_9BILA|nr:hypothetical protein WR25_19992 [Diploscapter pachys]
MIGAIVPYLTRIRRSYQSNDLVDRLNYHYTAFMIALGAVTLAASQYVGKPIQCWVPPQFTGSWEKYTESYCFIKGSYFVPDDEHPDQDFIKRDEAVIGYYQWIPLVLAFQAFCFYLPCVIWQGLNSASESGFVSRMRKSGHYLVVLYIFTKLLYVFNIFMQFCIFAIFLDTRNLCWGYTIFTDIINGREWDKTGNFPRVTMCDFNVRVLGAMHRWTVQCVLVMNMIAEKIFIFYWFWFILVGVLSILSLGYWLCALTASSLQRNFIAKYLRCLQAATDSPADEVRISAFVRHFLTGDGVFLLRLVQVNGGDILTGEIIAALYDKYTKRFDKEFAPESPTSSATATLPR